MYQNGNSFANFHQFLFHLHELQFVNATDYVVHGENEKVETAIKGDMKRFHENEAACKYIVLYLVCVLHSIGSVMMFDLRKMFQH